MDLKKQPKEDNLPHLEDTTIPIHRGGVHYPDDVQKTFLKGAEKSRFHYNPSQAPHYTGEEEETLILNPSNVTAGKAKRSIWFRCVQTLGIIFSVAWVLVCVSYFIMEGGLTTQTPYEMGIFVAGMTAPIAFFWMFLSYLQRNNDVKFYADSLRSEMHALFFPSEEESRHVNKDIERMTQQAAELAASSRAALKSIHRTRQGLRHEIREFASFARKAESHLISLSDKLAEKSANVAAITDTVDQRMADIEARSQSAVLIWDDASARMVERSADIEASMEEGANRILSMAELAEDKSKSVSDMFDGTITSLGLTVDAVIDRLGGINNDFEGHTRTLQISADELAKETSRIGSMIEGQINHLQDAAGRSVEAISQSLVEVSSHRDELDSSAENLSSCADHLADTILASVIRMNEASDDIAEQAEAVEGRLETKTESMIQTLDNFDTQINRIETVTVRARTRLTEGMEAAEKGADHIKDTIENSVERLVSASNTATMDAEHIIETAIDYIRKMKEAEKDNTGSMETMITLFESSRLQIEKAVETAAAHTDNLSRCVQSQGSSLEATSKALAEQVHQISQTLHDPLQQLSEAVSDADGRHNHMQQTLENRISELQKASDKASESVELIRHNLREQTAEISSLSGQVLSQSKILNKELNDNKIMLGETIDTALTDMNRFMGGIKDKSEGVSVQTAAAIRGLSSVNDHIEKAATLLDDVTASSTQSLKVAEDTLLTTANRVETKMDSTCSVIDMAGKNLTLSCEKILPLYERVENTSRSALEKLNIFKDNCYELTDVSVARIDYAVNQFEDRLVKLKANSVETTTTLQSTSEMLRDKLNDVECAAETAGDKMHALKQSMDNQSSEIHIVTDMATLKLGNIQRMINDQFHELSESVGVAVSQIDEACSQFETKAQTIHTSADSITDRFVTVSDDIYAKAYELKQLSTRLGESSQEAVSHITSQINSLSDCSSDNLSKLDHVVTAISEKSREAETIMQTILKSATIQYENIRGQMGAISEISDSSTRIISKSVTALLGTMDDVGAKTKSVVGYIQNANQSLYDQSGRFVTAVSKSAQAAEHATAIFSDQSDTLLKASKVAADRIEDIRKNELRAGRDSFLASARFVVESLHSLSIDFVRMIDGTIPDKDWKAYQKGDIALFTSKLADRLEQIPADKIRHKYAEDGEFRTYVQKFIHQFEEILEQTDTIDKGAILGTTFAASDVGKIYRFLCNIAGRTGKTV